MVSPQKEKGFTPIAHELFQAFYGCKLTEYERVLIMHIWRKTYGWDKKEDWISNSQFSEETGIARSHITRTIKLLTSKKIISKSGKKISVNKHYDQWKVEWRKLPHQVTIVTSPGNKKLPHQVPTKESKETIQKKLSETSSLIKNNDKDMWKRQPDDEDEVSIDYDSGETIKDPVLEEKAENKKITNNLKVLGEMRDLPFINLPTQRKRYKQLLVLGYTHLQIADEYEKLLVSEYWKKEKKENKRLPDMNSLYSNLSNKIKDE